MPNCADSARPSDERLHNIAAILATGLIRLAQRAALPPENPSELPLEVSDETVLSVHTELSRHV